MGEKVRPEDKPLTPREFLYCKALLKGKSRIQAARAAGVKSGTDTVLWVAANVQKFLRDFYEKEAAEIMLERAVILRSLYESSLADRSLAFKDDFKLKPLNEIPRSVRKEMLSARAFQSEDAGFSASAKFTSPNESRIAFLRLCPAPVNVQDHAKDRAAEELEEDMEMLARNLAEDLPE